MCIRDRFSAYATVASTSGYTVSVAADNSLVAAYNTAHGTSYAALPAEYLQLDNNPLTIAAGAYKSEGEVTVSLKGDLTRLSDLNGYLAPLKLSSSGAGTSAGRGVVYLAVKVERNKICLLYTSSTPAAWTTRASRCRPS